MIIGSRSKQRQTTGPRDVRLSSIPRRSVKNRDGQMQSTLLRSWPGPTSRRLSIGLLHCRPVCPGRRTSITLARLACSYFSQHHSSKPRARSTIFKATSQRRITRDYSQMTDIFYADPNRADLFYHFVHPPTPLSRSLPAFAVSFLNATPASPDSETVIGWLPAQTYLTDTPDIPGSRASQQPRETTAGLHDFVPNREFFSVRLRTGILKLTRMRQLNF